MSPFALTAALWFAADPAASRVDVSGGASIEVRGGVAPIQPSDERGTWGVLVVLNPDMDMEVESRRGTMFNLGYTPRVQYRSANRVDDLQTPLLLHQAYATVQQRIDPRWVLGVNLGGSIGEADYNAVPLVLGADQIDQPDLAVLQIAAASGGIEAEGRLTRRHTLRVEMSAVYRVPLNLPEVGEDGEPFEGGLPEQLNVEAPLSLDTRLSLADSIEVQVRPGYFNYNRGGTQFTTLQGTTQWRRQLRPSLSSSLGAGMFYFKGFGQTQATSVPVQPVVLGSLTGGLVRRASHNVDATLSAGLLPFFNRNSVSLESRATLAATLQIALPPRWTVRLVGGALTNATANPRVLDDGTVQPETQVRLAVPVTYEISDQQQFEFGLLTSARAPHLRYSPFEFDQEEIWLYVAYRIGAGTARGGQEVGQSGSGTVTRSTRGESNASGGGRR